MRQQLRTVYNKQCLHITNRHEKHKTKHGKNEKKIFRHRHVDEQGLTILTIKQNLYPFLAFPWQKKKQQ